jgi:hypothetical protein
MPASLACHCISDVNRHVYREFLKSAEEEEKKAKH